jgi:hypothetical protein
LPVAKEDGVVSEAEAEAEGPAVSAVPQGAEEVVATAEGEAVSVARPTTPYSRRRAAAAAAAPDSVAESL